MVKLGTGARTVEQGVVGVHHALGLAGGAGGKKHRAHVARLGSSHFIAKEVGVGGHIVRTAFLQLVHGRQTGRVVVAQTARVVVVNVGELRGIGLHFEQLVHLLLVFGKGKAHFSIDQGVDTFGSRSVLVQGHRDATQSLHCQHGRVQAGAVRTHHHHVVAFAQTCLVQAACELLDHGGQFTPGQRLPNAVFLFTHGSGVGPLGSVVHQQLRKSRLHSKSL